ncbi:hypothetical protein [Paratractidigestivibacter sp.]|uniref:hypothetical protein n=1 Tax=Paratractidigestivibacter sp. TaxID=2847316 RepID=UPI002ABD40F5|nr:hypothetical protein [Paratractidigestivibacter sp.]
MAGSEQDPQAAPTGTERPAEAVNDANVRKLALADIKDELASKGFKAAGEVDQAAGERMATAQAEGMRRHWQTISPDPAPGFIGLTVDTDIPMQLPVLYDGEFGYVNLTVRKGMYFVDKSERDGGLGKAAKEGGGRCWLYTMKLSSLAVNGRQVTPTPDFSEEDGVVVDQNGVVFSGEGTEVTGTITMCPYKTKYREEPVSHQEALLFTTIMDLRAEGKEEEAERLLKDSYQYNVRVAASTEQDGGEFEPEESAGPPVVRVYAEPLEDFTSDHSYESQVLQKLEEAAFDTEDTGVYVLSKDGEAESLPRVEWRTAPGDVTGFFMSKHASWSLALRIRVTVAELIRRGGDTCEDGVVWITTATIIRELTRTESGTGRSAPYDTEFKATVNNCLHMLTAGRVRSYGKTGKVKAEAPFFIGVYRATAQDTKGNVYHDVWGFQATGDGISYHKSIGRYLKHYPLLDPVATTGKDSGIRPQWVWVEAYVYDHVVSIIRRGIYRPVKKGEPAPDRSKLEETWESVFTRSGMDPATMNSNTKQAIVEAVDRTLKAAAVAQAREAKPVYIQATSKRNPDYGRGAGEWGKIVVTGYRDREGHKPYVKLGAKKRVNRKK